MQGTQYATKRSILCRGAFCGPTVLDSRQRGRWFEPLRRYCVVSLSKNINPSLVLVQPRKTRPFITGILFMGRKESNQTKNAFGAPRPNKNPDYTEWPQEFRMVTCSPLILRPRPDP